MSKLRTNSATSDPAVGQQPERPAGRSSENPLPDAFTQILAARDRLIAAIIERAEKDGCHQRTKWLFEFGGIVPAGHTAPEDESSLIRSLLEALQIPETPEEIAAELSANDHVVE
jgi:hypothetical protein